MSNNDQPGPRKCPCCRSNAYPYAGQKAGWSVKCSNDACGLTTPICDTEADALRIWDRRDPPRELSITQRQREIYEKLKTFSEPPTYGELCQAMGLNSRGSMHTQIKALVDAGLVYPLNGRRHGIRVK